MEQKTAEELAKKQREISVAEFFEKNRHLLGFDNPRKALLMAVKEATDNSLTYDMPLLLRRKGDIELVRIGEFIDQQAEKFFTKTERQRDGQLERLPAEENIEVLAFDPKTLKTNFHKVSTLFRHKVNSKIYRVTLTSGRYVDLTAYHSVFTLKEGEVVAVPTAKLKEGMPLIVPKSGWQQPNPPTEINVVEELLRLDPKITARINVYGINNLLTEIVVRRLKELLPQSKRYKIVDFRKCNYLPLNLLRELPISLDTFNNSKVGPSLCRHKIPAVIPLNYQFAELLGIYMAEGSLLSSLRRLYLSFGSQEKEMVLYFADLFEKVFKLKPKIAWAHPTAYNLICNSSMICFFFKNILKVGVSAKDKKLPSLVFNLKPDLQYSLLMAYLAGDGYPTRDIFYALKNDLLLTDLSAQKITCATASFELFMGLQYLLSSLRLGYSCGQNKAKRRLVKGNVAIFGQSYYLYIYTKNDHGHLNYLPIKETIIGTTDAKLRHSISRDNQTKVHYNTIQKVLPSGNLILNQGLSLFLQGDLGVLSIKKIEEIPYHQEWVYDVSVPGCENFVAGVGAIVCHNSLDACEEARILPEIDIELIQLAENRFRVVVEDNGPGIVKEQIPKIFAKLLYGSKFHKLSQSRGQQGIGISAAVLYGQLTSGKPATILSKTAKGKKAHKFKLKINTQTNSPDIMEDTEEEWDKEHGVRVEIDMEGSYQKGRQSVDEFLKETAIINPHATFIYTNPEANQTLFSRVTNTLPPEAKEIQPHPYGVELGRLMKMLELTTSKTLQQFLTTEFSRVGVGTAKEICENAALLPNTKPPVFSREMVEQLFNGIQKTKIMSPPTDCLSPLGHELLEKSLKKEINAEFYCAVTRPVFVYRGNPFQIEIGIAYGGEQPKEEAVTLLRFANRVPLLYQQGACAFTKSIITTNWKPYGLQQSQGAIPTGPATIVLHIASVWVPFTSESKEALNQYPDIIKEIKLALQEAGRKLQSYVNKKGRVQGQLERASMFENYIPEVAASLAKLTGESRDRIMAKLKEMVKKEQIQQQIYQMEALKGEVDEETKLAEKNEDDDV